MDQTAKIWDIETGKCIANLEGHQGEIVSMHFSSEGDRLITASFDNTARV
jgi:dynein assembly factor with WDR repeat domains 1